MDTRDLVQDGTINYETTGAIAINTVLDTIANIGEAGIIINVENLGAGGAITVRCGSNLNPQAHTLPFVRNLLTGLPVATITAVGLYYVPQLAAVTTLVLTTATTGGATRIRNYRTPEHHLVGGQGGLVAAIANWASIAGNSTHSSAAPSTGLVAAAKVQTGVDTTLTNNDAQQLFTGVNGALVTQDFAVPDVQWRYTGRITVTAAQTIKAAVASQRNYITSLQFQNGTPPAGLISVLSGSTVIWQGFGTGNMSVPASIVFPCPLRGGVSEAITVTCATAGDLALNMQGYVGL